MQRQLCHGQVKLTVTQHRHRPHIRQQVARPRRMPPAARQRLGGNVDASDVDAQFQQGSRLPTIATADVQRASHARQSMLPASEPRILTAQRVGGVAAVPDGGRRLVARRRFGFRWGRLQGLLRRPSTSGRRRGPFPLNRLLTLGIRFKGPRRLPLRGGQRFVVRAGGGRGGCRSGGGAVGRRCSHAPQPTKTTTASPCAKPPSPDPGDRAAPGGAGAARGLRTPLSGSRRRCGAGRTAAHRRRCRSRHATGRPCRTGSPPTAAPPPDRRRPGPGAC